MPDQAASDGLIPRPLTGSRAIVIGGVAGIDRAIASRFPVEGARVVMADIDLEAAKEVARAIGPETLARKVDVSSEESAAAMVHRATQE